MSSSGMPSGHATFFSPERAVVLVELEKNAPIFEQLLRIYRDDYVILSEIFLVFSDFKSWNETFTAMPH